MKNVVRAVLILICVFCFPPSALAAEASPIVIVVDGVPLETDRPPFLEQDEIMATVQDLATAMGLDAFNSPGGEDIWVDDPVFHTRLIVSFSDNPSADPRMEVVAGETISDRLPPKMVDGYLYVPLEPFAEVFGYSVDWDQQTRTATVANKLEASFFAGKSANTKYSLINDRLFVYLPAGAEARSDHYSGIMGSGSSDDGETSLVMTGNDQTLEVKANEVYAYSTGDLKKDAALYVDLLNSRYAQPAAYSISEAVVAEDFAFISIQPQIHDYWSDYLVEGALVRAADHTLVFVGVYGDQKAMTYPEDCRSLARQIISSLESGARLLPVEGQLYSIGDYTIKLAPDYIPTLYHGPDFEVRYFNKLTTLDKVSSSFGIYRGNHPAYDDTKKVTDTLKDRAFGRKITWRLYTDLPGVFDANSYAETIIRTGTSGWDTYLHIFASPASETDWQDILVMVRSLNGANDSARFTTGFIYGLMIVVVSGIIMLVIRKRKKAKRLMNAK